MMRSDKPIIAITIAIVAIVIIGEVVVYTSDYTDYNATASYDTASGTVHYEISASGSKVYTAMIIDHVRPTDRVYLYYDGDYESAVEDVTVAVGARELTQDYYIDQLQAVLKYRNIQAEIVDADRLAELMNLSGTGQNVVCISGALPVTVYDGSSSSAIFSWLDSGGNLFWAGNLIGRYYSTTEEIVEVPSGFQSMFFGSECLNTGDTNKATEEVTDNGLTHGLSLVNNDTKYGIDISRISGRDTLSTGFVNNGYTSVSAVQYGSGSIFVFGGDYSNNQRNDIAQIIASGISPSSSIVAENDGTVTRGTVKEDMAATGSDLGIYIYLGGYYPVYGRLCILS